MSKRKKLGIVFSFKKTIVKLKLSPNHYLFLGYWEMFQCYFQNYGIIYAK